MGQFDSYILFRRKNPALLTEWMLEKWDTFGSLWGILYVAPETIDPPGLRGLEASGTSTLFYLLLFFFVCTAYHTVLSTAVLYCI